jgi:hypothetical protein
MRSSFQRPASPRLGQPVGSVTSACITYDKYMAVTLTARGTELVAGRPRELFPSRTVGSFDVFPDGRRIAAPRQTEAVDGGGPSDNVHLTLVVMRSKRFDARAEAVSKDSNEAIDSSDWKN